MATIITIIFSTKIRIPQFWVKIWKKYHRSCWTIQIPKGNKMCLYHKWAHLSRLRLKNIRF